ncbi:MAG: superoxide dismutase, Ni [Thermoplasmata archaeon]
MSLTDGALGWFHAARDLFVAPAPAYAHCDIPCGIYEPHTAQIAALTVFRMDQLIGELVRPAEGAPAEAQAKYHSQFARYVQVKESHSDRCESELTTLWADYFNADLRKKYPEVEERFWKALQAVSKARQGVALADAQELLSQVQAIAELFWQSKGVPTRKVPSTYKTGGEIVVPAG